MSRILKGAALVAGAIVVSALGAMPQALHAQEAYPTRAVQMIVPFPPGGASERITRPLVAELQKIWNQPVVLETKAGAAGAVGATYAANAKPDGYTILSHIVSVSAFPEVDRLFGRAPKYELSDLLPVARINNDPVMLVVHSDTPYKSVKDLIEDAKKRPNEITYSSSGPYGALHIPYQMLLTAGGGLKMKHLPSNGAGPAMVSLLGNNAQVMVTSIPPATPHVKSGKIRALAVFSENRLAAFPDVPTMKELGYDVQFALWAGLFVPKGTPEPIITKIREGVAKAVKSPDFIKTMGQQGLEIHYQDAPEFAAYWKADAEKIGKAIREIGKIEN